MSATATRPAIAAATFERIARAILANNGAGKTPHPALVEDTIRELEYRYETTGAIPTAHQSRISEDEHGRPSWTCSCGKGSKTPASSRSKAGNGQAKHIDAARGDERRRAAVELAIHNTTTTTEETR